MTTGLGVQGLRYVATSQTRQLPVPTSQPPVTPSRFEIMVVIARMQIWSKTLVRQRLRHSGIMDIIIN